MTIPPKTPFHLAGIAGETEKARIVIEACRPGSHSDFSCNHRHAQARAPGIIIRDPKRHAISRSLGIEDVKERLLKIMLAAIGREGTAPPVWKDAALRLMADLQTLEKTEERISVATLHGASGIFASCSVVIAKTNGEMRKMRALGPEDVAEYLRLPRFASISIRGDVSNIEVFIDDAFSVSAFREDLDPITHTRLLRSTDIPRVPSPERVAERIWC